jgi:pimeloyl-ACP methyl ester carboxylesterase
VAPLVIFAHGLGDSGYSGIDYARAFAKQGYSAYTFDFNHGTFRDDMTKMSIFTERDDLNTVVDHFKEQGYQNIYLLGASQGGVVSAMVAAQRDDIRGLMLLYPAFVIPDMMHDLFPRQDFPTTFNLMGMTLGREYVKDLPGYNLLGTVSKYQGPVLIFHGTRDLYVPIHYSQQAAAMYPHAQLITVQGAGHGFYGHQEKTVTADLIDFVRKH